MNTTGASDRVILVDDQEWTQTPFVEALGPIVDWCANVSQLEQRIEHREAWTTAFVDFNLGPNQPCGLNAMRLLRRACPNIRLVSLTGLSENGRTLFMAAAAHWYEAMLLNKDDLDPAKVRRAVDPASNPTAPLLRQRLRQAHLVDDLFAEPSWLQIWQVWPQFNGTQSAVVSATGYGSGVVRGFAERATVAVNNFELAFGDTEPVHTDPLPRTSPKNTQRDPKRQFAAPLTRFARENRQVFFAPDVDQVINDLHVRRGPR